MTGTDGSETIYSYGGGDRVSAGRDNDTVYGGPGDVIGGGASDKLYGGKGSDGILAWLSDAAGSTDTDSGGGGNDLMSARDGNVDVINCGKGTDAVFYDVGTDTIKACEIENPE